MSIEKVLEAAVEMALRMRLTTEEGSGTICSSDEEDEFLVASLGLRKLE